MTFTADQFDVIRSGIQRSARALAPQLLTYLNGHGLKADDVIDVGCGEGWWAAELAQLGLDATGVDGPGGGSALAGLGQFHEVDLAGPDYPEMGLFGLAVCLEVGEHLPDASADRFVGWLCDLAPVIVFSAAIPGQGGQRHINEQWPDYWCDKFNARGMQCTGRLRDWIWNDQTVEVWYRQNLMLAWRPRSLRLAAEKPRRMVHPELWSARLGLS